MPNPDCQQVIPNTFIACGEGGNYCSDACYQASRARKWKLATRHYRREIQEWARMYDEQTKLIPEAFDCGAAVAFGLMGMFEAIREKMS